MLTKIYFCSICTKRTNVTKHLFIVCNHFFLVSFAEELFPISRNYWARGKYTPWTSHRYNRGHLRNSKEKQPCTNLFTPKSNLETISVSTHDFRLWEKARAHIENLSVLREKSLGQNLNPQTSCCKATVLTPCILFQSFKLERLLVSQFEDGIPNWKFVAQPQVKFNMDAAHNKHWTFICTSAHIFLQS